MTKKDTQLHPSGNNEITKKYTQLHPSGDNEITKKDTQLHPSGDNEITKKDTQLHPSGDNEITKKDTQLIPCFYKCCTIQQIFNLSFVILQTQSLIQRKHCSLINISLLSLSSCSFFF